MSNALHSCGNGHLGCVNPRHVYWGDEADNARDAARHRTEGKPEARRRKGEPSPRIAATSGNPPGISSPRHGEAWSFVRNELEICDRRKGTVARL